MVNEIIKGISRTLYQNFQGSTIYVDNVPQGMKKPSFFIMNIEDVETPLLGNRAMREMAFVIHYFPKTEKNEELHEVASQLFGLLRRIKLINGDSLNGLKLHREIEDSVLFFYVQFKPIVYYPNEEKVGMGAMDYSVGMKEV